MHTMWKGSISFGLVHIPIKLYAATEEKDIKLRFLHEECGTPIRYSRTCPTCEKEVPNEEIIKGYEYEPGQFVPINKEEIEEIKGQATRSVEILDFVNLEDIDPIYFNKSYFVGPNDNGEKAYSLLKQALQDTKKIGLAKLTLHSKQHLAVVRVYDKGLLLETIYYPDEVRNAGNVPGIDKIGDVNEKELQTAIQLVDQLTTPFEPEQYENEYRRQLHDLIQAKIAGDQVKKPKKAPKQENVVDLLSALQASIDETKPPTKKEAAKKPAAKKTSPKTKKTKKASS
ncbi:DNA end-binding protein Ku [Scopulibacillus darangshiensis]|uniref:Non-homologous end joining protein Ku n=1 Tax=Scopulibacillus darangshiensis TaxID=442528 RepID=A0A4R2P6C3_9BACL|nr:Ku protein [Scopulibacillus darangshiensis]TCP29778.1 DNA end-binding protein Ku [Scopulibacillus darangshiensis]